MIFSGASGSPSEIIPYQTVLEDAAATILGISSSDVFVEVTDSASGVQISWTVTDSDAIASMQTSAFASDLQSMLQTIPDLNVLLGLASTPEITLQVLIK